MQIGPVLFGDCCSLLLILRLCFARWTRCSRCSFSWSFETGCKIQQQDHVWCLDFAGDFETPRCACSTTCVSVNTIKIDAYLSLLCVCHLHSVSQVADGRTTCIALSSLGRTCVVLGMCMDVLRQTIQYNTAARPMPSKDVRHVRLSRDSSCYSDQDGHTEGTFSCYHADGQHGGGPFAARGAHAFLLATH